MRMPKCVFCGHEIKVGQGEKIGRREECLKCGRDLHSCVQCSLFDRSYHNNCRESQSQVVSDKEASNFCEFFSFGRDVADERLKVEDTKSKLEELFKKDKTAC